MTLLSTLLVCGLSACTTVATTYYAPRCFTELVTASGLKADTAHAALPVEGTAGAWVAYGNQEGGKLDIANGRARAINGIGETCERWQEEAKKKAEKKPWWRRVFG
ncbi:hypothetical protein [Novosphingobium meiothermophilum]|uniref:hypothetical protein n=1 Tax=Novosphingobium meiothermophilum TaxID=2202251 RepID=UPI0011AB7523|nr:hypothetical protein [Novosphingobium meiothermophilum]